MSQNGSTRGSPRSSSDTSRPTSPATLLSAVYSATFDPDRNAREAKLKEYAADLEGSAAEPGPNARRAKGQPKITTAAPRGIIARALHWPWMKTSANKKILALEDELDLKKYDKERYKTLFIQNERYSAVLAAENAIHANTIRELREENDKVRAEIAHAAQARDVKAGQLTEARRVVTSLLQASTHRARGACGEDQTSGPLDHHADAQTLDSLNSHLDNLAADGT